MTGRSKVPQRPSRPLEWDAADVLTRGVDQVLWRIHKTRGAYPTAWNDYRMVGPLPGLRWDPHPPGQPANHHGCGVLYAAYDLNTCLAEVFQAGNRIDTTGSSPYATAWNLTRPLRLLNLTGDWPMRMGAAHALLSAPRSTCKNWAHAIWEASRTSNHPVDGLDVRSTVTGKNMPVLFSASQSALPAAPDFTSPLDGPKVLTLVDHFADRYQWTVT